MGAGFGAGAWAKRTAAPRINTRERNLLHHIRVIRILLWLAAVVPLAAQIRFAPAPAPLPFTLEHSPTAQKHMLETMPGGLAVLDYNNDGRPDLFFTNGASLPALKKDQAKFHNRLFRNDGGWKFTDVTAEAGLAGEGYSMGAAAADYDNDGYVDLFIAGVYRNQLFRNLGNGRFTDVTAKSGILSNEWSVAAGWFDYDNDGRLDLLVTNYGRIDLVNPRYCGDRARELRIYCHPRYYDPRPNQLYRNLGNGAFADVSVASGIAGFKGRGMSIAFADYDHDGRIDAFVTNDNLPNFLFHNLGNGRFEESALLAGVALLDHGKSVASMGTDFRDYDNDGKPDIIVTALNGETYPLFRNKGAGIFQDFTYGSQLSRMTNTYAGWGVGLVDFDNDGLKDLFTANAHVNDIVEKFEATVYRQPNTVFRNAGGGRFELVPSSGLEASKRPHRGAVFADFDGDGLVDAAVTSLGEPVELWKNVTPLPGAWLALKLEGVKSNRDGIGAAVRVGLQTNIMTTSVSYASAIHAPVWFGLGTAKEARVEILWPSGRRQVIESAAAGQVLTVRETAQ